MKKLFLILICFTFINCNNCFASDKIFVLKKGSLVSRTESSLRKVDKYKKQEDFEAINTLRNAGIIAFTVQDLPVFVEKYYSGEIIKIRPQGSVQEFWTHSWMVE